MTEWGLKTHVSQFTIAKGAQQCALKHASSSLYHYTEIDIRGNKKVVNLFDWNIKNQWYSIANNKDDCEKEMLVLITFLYHHDIIMNYHFRALIKS